MGYRNGLSRWARNDIFNSSRWPSWNHLTTTFASLVVVIGGVAGWIAKTSSEENATLDAKVASQRADISDLTETIGELEMQAATDKGTIDNLKELNSGLQQRVSELERQVQPVPDDSQAPPVRKAARLTLAVDGDTIDLNSIATNFNSADPDAVSGDDILYLEDGGASPDLQFGYFSDVSSVRVEGTARYATCAIASGWKQIQSVRASDLQDARTCLRLASGRIAVIAVDGYTRSAADLFITVWELP